MNLMKPVHQHYYQFETRTNTNNF